MISDCLNNFIGLRGYCDDVTPVSGLYINDLPGISLKMAASIANAEQQNFSGLWDEIYTRSLTRFEADVAIRMQKYFKTNLLVDQETAGYYRNDYDTVASSNAYKGVAIKVYGSNATKIYINSVTLRLESVTNTSGNIYIFDYNDGRTLDTISFTAANGVNEIQINKAYFAKGQKKRIFVAYDSNIGAAISSDTTSIYDYYRFASIRGGSITVGTTVNKDNITFGGESYGMVLNFSIGCSIEPFICSHRDLLKTVFWYLLGAEMMKERLMSDRINQFTMANREQAESIHEDFEEKYKTLMDTILDNMEPSSDNLCFTCSKKRNYLYSKP